MTHPARRVRQIGTRSPSVLARQKGETNMVTPPLVFGTSWLIERARTEAAKAPELIPGTPLYRDIAAILAGIPDVPAPLAGAA